MFPPGLPVGVVSAVNGGTPRIAPYVELSRVEYVRIVDYGLAGGLPKPVASAPQARRQTPFPKRPWGTNRREVNHH